MANTTNNVFAIDISTASIKVAVLRRVHKETQLIKFHEEAIPISALVGGVIRRKQDIQLALQKCLREVNGKNHGLFYGSCTIPDDKVYTQEATFPQLSSEKLREAIQFKLQTFIPLPLSEVYWDFIVLPKSNDANIHVIIAAAAKETVNSYYEAIKSAGIIPISFETSTMAGLRYLAPQTDESILLIDMGKTQTTIALATGGTIEFSSTIHAGVNLLIKKYNEFFKIDDDKSTLLLKENGIDVRNPKLHEELIILFSPLIEEIKRIVTYEKGKTLKIVLYGEGALIKGLNTLLGEADLGEFIALRSYIKGVKLGFLERIIPVLGAGMQPFAKQNGEHINFLPPQASKEVAQNFIREKILFILRMLFYNMFFYIIIFTIFISYLYIDQSYLSQKLTAESSPSREQRFTQTSLEINTFNQSLQTLHQASIATNDWTGVLKEFPTQVPQGITINALNLNSNKKGWDVTISGNAKERNTLLLYVHALEYNSKYFTKVNLPISVLQSDQSIIFTINAVITKLNI